MHQDLYVNIGGFVLPSPQEAFLHLFVFLYDSNTILIYSLNKSTHS